MRWDEIRWRFDILLAIIIVYPKKATFPFANGAMERTPLIPFAPLPTKLLCHNWVNGANGANGVQAPLLYSIEFWMEQIYTKADNKDDEERKLQIVLKLLNIDHSNNENVNYYIATLGEIL